MFAIGRVIVKFFLEASDRLEAPIHRIRYFLGHSYSVGVTRKRRFRKHLCHSVVQVSFSVLGVAVLCFCVCVCFCLWRFQCCFLRGFVRRREEIAPEGSPYCDYRFMAPRGAVGPMAAIRGAHYSLISGVTPGRSCVIEK